VINCRPAAADLRGRGRPRHTSKPHQQTRASGGSLVASGLVLVARVP